MADDYQTVYGVTLLDDLHNYFPRILYNPQQFQSVPDLLAYVQQTTRTRFNLFDNGMRQYASSMRAQQQQQVQQPHNTYATAAGAAAYINANANANAQQSTAIDPVSASLLPLLRSLIVPRVVRIPLNTTFNDPVIVHANQELIEASSTQETLEEDSENNCAICQDSMSQGELVRKITVCSHEFHRSCIDNWLLNSSVLCPTCRHDIREPARAPSTRNTPVLTARTQAQPYVQTQAQPYVQTQAPQQVIQTPQSNRNIIRERGEDALAAELIGSLSFLL